MEYALHALITEDARCIGSVARHARRNKAGSAMISLLLVYLLVISF